MKNPAKWFIGLILVASIGYLLRLDVWTLYHLKTRNVKFYNPNKDLTCEDFKDEKKSNGKYTIGYEHGFGCIYNSGLIFMCECFSYFVPDNSWLVCYNDSVSKENLDFQKIIFQLNEIYARKLEAELRILKQKGKLISDEEFQTLFDKYKLERTMRKHEIESDFSFDTYRKKIDHWTNKIREELEETATYTGDKI